MSKTIDNKYYNFDSVINDTDRFIKPEDFALPDLVESDSKFNLYVKAGCGKGKSDQTLALCANLVEKGFVNNGIICLAPNKTLCDSLHFRFSGERLVKTVLDDGESTKYVPKIDKSWKAPHGYNGKVSTKDVGMIHYQDPEYTECLAPKDGSPINLAVVINSIIRIFPSYVKRKKELRRELDENLGKTEEEIEQNLEKLDDALKDDYLAIVPSVLVIDEFFSFILNMSSATMNNTRRRIVSILSLMIKHCTYLICLDAHLNDECIDILRQLRPNKTTYTKFVWYKQPSNTHLKCLEVEKKRFIDIIEQKLTTNKKIFICSNLKKHGADYFESYISNEFPNLKILSITSDTSIETKRLSSNAESEFVKYDVVIVSPSVIYGVDYSGDHFDSVFGYYKNHTIMANMAGQQLRRVRNPKSNEIYVCYDNVAYDSYTAAISERDIDTIIDKRFTKSNKEQSDGYGTCIREDDIYCGITDSGKRELSLFGAIYRQIIKFELESNSNFSSWVRSFLCDEGIRYYSEVYKQRLPDAKLKKLEAKMKTAAVRNQEYQWAMYDLAPDYDNDSQTMEDPIGAQKFFHKIAFGLQTIDKEFFNKFIEPKHHMKMDNLKKYLMDDEDVKDLYDDTVKDEEKEMVHFKSAREMIIKLLDICCDGRTDVFDFKVNFEPGDVLPQIDSDWVKDNHLALRTTFGDSGRVQMSQENKSGRELARNNNNIRNTSILANLRPLAHQQEICGENKQPTTAFEDKKLVVNALTRILSSYLGLSVDTKTKRVRENGTRKLQETRKEIKNMDEMMELLMYSDSYYCRSDKLSDYIKEWAKDNTNQCRWYHLKDPKVTGITIAEAAKEIYELKMIDDDADL